MIKHISVDNASPQVKDFVQQLGGEQKDYIVEIAGRPVVGIVPPWQVEKLAQDRQEVLALLRQSWEQNRTLSEAEVEQVVAEAIQEVRREGQN